MMKLLSVVVILGLMGCSTAHVTYIKDGEVETVNLETSGTHIIHIKSGNITIEAVK